MTTYKLCLAFIVLVSVSVTASSLYDTSYQQRARRAAAEGKEKSVESTTEDAEDVGYQGGYRFGEEFFLPEASKSIPAEYKKKADGCERVVKDSMVCMVCKDPKTNAKYEQCSYVGNPPPTTPPSRQSTEKKETSYAPESSSESSSESSTAPRGSYENYESSTPPRGSSTSPRGSEENYESSTPSRGAYESSTAPRSTYESSTPSRSTYESSTPPRSTYESSTPPRSNYESSTPSRGTYESSTPSRGAYDKYEASKPEATRYDYKHEAPAPYSYTESSKEDAEGSEDPAESTNCRQVDKNSHSCRICKDPKTGKDFERCTTSYQPDDKSYAYGKTEKYGYPESREEEKEDKAENKSYETKAESGEDQAETSECRQVKKDDQTCTICKDPKTGGDSERCTSSYSPGDKSYAYGTSSRYGSAAPHNKDNYKSYGSDDGDKTAESTYHSPSEYHYPGSSGDTYSKYHTDVPSEYRQSSYDGGYHGSSPSYGSSSGGAEYASPSVPAASTKTSGSDAGAGCREVQKDSMTCTVCTDPKTGRNSEKCSYAYQPNDKVYKFTKSKTFGYPGTDGGKGGEEGGNKGSADAQRLSESKQVADTIKAGACKEIRKDSMVCTVCKDPKTGASSEQCAYGTMPTEKIFSYIASKSFGTPRKDGEASDKDAEQQGKQESRPVPQWSDEQSRQFVAESKQVADSVQAGPCRKIEKDTMTCTVCKDPKTGASSEQCSYASKPKQNHYTYSQSKTSGTPRKGEEEEAESKQSADSAEATSPCKKVEKDSMICTICKDPKTGANSEQCAYSSKPKERHFTYTKSKSFGSPRKDGDGKEEEKPEESHHISRWSNDGQDYYAKVNRPRGFSKPDWSYGE